jgi:hypothetical protein
MKHTAIRISTGLGCFNGKVSFGWVSINRVSDKYRNRSNNQAGAKLKDLIILSNYFNSRVVFANKCVDFGDRRVKESQGVKGVKGVKESRSQTSQRSQRSQRSQMVSNEVLCQTTLLQTKHLFQSS